MSEGMDEIIEEIVPMEDASAQTALDEYSAEENPAENSGETKAVWLDRHCRLLISLYKRYKGDLGRTYACKTRAKMRMVIAAKMREHGYSFNAQQIEGKLRSLKRGFINNVMYKRRTGRARYACSYEKELMEVFGDEPELFSYNVKEETETKPQLFKKLSIGALKDENKCFQNAFSTYTSLEGDNMDHIIEEFVPMEEIVPDDLEESLDEYPEEESPRQIPGKGKAVWLDQHCQLLTSLYKELKEDVEDSRKVKTKSRMWSTIAAKMREHGYNFTPQQVEGKCKSLDKKFQKESIRDKNTSKGRSTCNYEKDLIFEFDEPFPDFTVTSCGDGTSKRQLLEKSIVGPLRDDSMPSTSRPVEVNQRSKKKIEVTKNANNSAMERTFNDEKRIIPSKRNKYAAEEVRAWREQRAAENREREKRKEIYRKNKTQLVKERNEQLRKRNDELKRKNDLLEGFLNFLRKN